MMSARGTVWRVPASFSSFFFLSHVPKHEVEHPSIAFWIGYGELERVWSLEADLESKPRSASLRTLGPQQLMLTSSPERLRGAEHLED